jgi:hypothetical protein
MSVLSYYPTYSIIILFKKWPNPNCGKEYDNQKGLQEAESATKAKLLASHMGFRIRHFLGGAGRGYCGLNLGPCTC